MGQKPTFFLWGLPQVWDFLDRMSNQSTTSRLIELISPLTERLGYEIVHLEIQTQRQKILRIFIDHVAPSDQAIGIQDCVKATHALDKQLEQMPEIDKLFGDSSYELEVSSPGIDRPLRLSKDYERFSGREVRIHLFRPLTSDEIGNAEYFSKNPKQKNFVGTLLGLREDRVLLALPKTSGKSSRKTASLTNSVEKDQETVMIPLPLIAKANLEPKFESWNERE